MPRIIDNMMSYIMEDIQLNTSDTATELEPSKAPSENFIKANITRFKQSETYKYMLVAQKYADIENKEINDRRRYYIDFDGNEVESKYLANNKLASAKFPRMVAQKVGYLISKPFTIKSENKEVVKFLEKQFNQRGLRKIKKWVNEAIVNGIEYMMEYFDENGVMCWKRIPGYEVVPFWKDEDHSELEACIRFYKTIKYLADGTAVEYYKYEYHSTQGSWYFIDDEGGLRADPEYADPSNKKNPLQQGHFKLHMEKRDENGVIIKDENGDGVVDEYDAVWHTLPIIPLSYQYEKSLLKFIKPKVDDYDRNTSDVSNTLEEVTQAIKVIKGYDGSDPKEVAHNMNVLRMIFVSGEDGSGVENLTTTIDTEAVEKHLTRLDDDIYVDGGGVNLKNDELGNASGAAIKYRYSGLENDMKDFSAELSLALQQLSWFLLFGQVMNGALDESVLHESIEFIFNTDMVTNELETVQMLQASNGMASRKTIVANHPLVENVDEELAAMDAEDEEQRAESMALANRYGFGNQVVENPTPQAEPTEPTE